MPGYIQSISFTNEFHANTTDWLLGNILEKIVVTIDVQFSWALGNYPKGLTFAASGNYIISLGPYNFINEGFNIGDTITIAGTVSNNSTTGVITGFGSGGLQIYLSGVVLVNESAVASATVTGTTPILGVKLRANLIENLSSESYLSLIDNNENLWQGFSDYTDVSYDPMIQQGIYNSNHLGSAQIRGYDGATKNRFLIQHTFYIMPAFTYSELANFEAGIAPPYFFGPKCLKYAYQLEGLFQLYDPNKSHKSAYAYVKLGNTGWFNENFNNGLNKFTQNPAVYTIAGVSSAFADYQQATDFSITIDSDNSIFSAGNTKLLISHFILTESDAASQNTATDFTENFAWDRKLLTEGAAAVNGENYGTSKQVFTNLQFTRISNAQARVTGKIDLSSANKSLIGGMSDRKFVLACTVQDHTKTTTTSDKETLMAGVDYYDTDLSNPGLGGVSTSFYFHPSTAVPIGYGGMFVEDGIIAESSFHVDITNSPTINRASAIVRAVKGSDRFELERKDFSFANAVFQAGVQIINISQTRGFKLKSGNPFNEISLVRDVASDSGNLKYYTLKYPFKIRWEDFIALLGVDAAFYDVAELNNGRNHDWNRYFTEAGWSLEYEVRVEVEENDYVNVLSSTNTVNAYFYDDATDWSPATFVVKDSNGNSTGGYLLGNDTGMTITATFEKLSGGNPALADITGMIEVQPYQSGGSPVIRQCSTLRAFESDSPFISTTGNDLADKSVVGAFYTITIKLDGTKLAAGTQYYLSARVYDGSVPPFDGASKQFQAGDAFNFQDGTQYDFQT
jgi:hypothetical protein